MKVRRIRALAELPDKDFLAAVSEGCALVHANAERLFADAALARDANARRGYLILRGHAEEEASKALILLDAVRCPTSEGGRRSTQLGKCLDHLSRMIYSEICGYRPKDFRELEHLIDNLREEYYLDGPSGCDWIYRNRLLQSREGSLYVDYVETEDGRRWDTPNDHMVEMLTYGPALAPSSLGMVRHLVNVGALSVPGIAIVAELWRSCIPASDSKWGEFMALNGQTLEKLDAAGLCHGADGADRAAVRDNWPFPLWSLETKLKEVKFADLVEARSGLAERFPEGY